MNPVFPSDPPSKIVIKVVGTKLLNLDMGFSQNGMTMHFHFILSGRRLYLYMVIHSNMYYLCSTPVTLAQTRLG